jgi:DNA-binding NarL/FixJ family response regulator
MNVIQKRCANCKIVIISQSSDPYTADKTIGNGAAAFIYKDKDALEKSCYFVEEYANVNFS